MDRSPENCATSPEVSPPEPPSRLSLP
ncbi:hypothetical protein R2601_04478 [Salipiger bermudensis HTCC2601]|uniref:Uncharacterized protein n=1 Tax=Salipiger bermudensis (strain DSM 26914 / JCM 13377 / KCTC 12554 / HTCC2601) TaxID=314265 RepID=Q0FVV0_SALBH|nr:hypothetical protein R2601_04478 [Salipiger bermudensis HTCC2601]